MIEIRQVGEKEWSVLREIRLRALAVDPAVFSSNLSREEAFSESTWRSRLADPDAGIFVLYSGDEPVGMTGVVIDRDDPPNKQRCFGDRGCGPTCVAVDCRSAYTKRGSPGPSGIRPACASSSRTGKATLLPDAPIRDTAFAGFAAMKNAGTMVSSRKSMSTNSFSPKSSVDET